MDEAYSNFITANFSMITEMVSEMRKRQDVIVSSMEDLRRVSSDNEKSCASLNCKVADISVVTRRIQGMFWVFGGVVTILQIINSLGIGGVVAQFLGWK